jgi:hypothetical protein
MSISCTAAQLDWQVSGNEFSGLVGSTRPISDIRSSDLIAPKQSLAPRLSVSYGN